MQIDFHFNVIYVLSRLAGFSKDDSHTIASSSQYVDDATNEGLIEFDNFSTYQYISSAHKYLDYRNFKKLAIHKVWIPFHFLPSNQYLPELSHIPEFIQRVTCRPNSEVAQKLLSKVFELRKKKNALHLLGIALHIYADTWSHQGFLGIQHPANDIKEIFDINGQANLEFLKKRKKYYWRQNQRMHFRNSINFITFNFFSDLLSKIDPIGHGAVLSLPDLPYMIWKYKDSFGEMITRNNPEEYMDSVQHIFKILVKFKTDASEESLLIPESDFQMMYKNFAMFKEPLPFQRHQMWNESIRKGEFSFGSESVQYFSEGPQSWLDQYFGTVGDVNLEDLSPFVFQKSFFNSDWKKAQDALIMIRHLILHDILPQFEICVY